MELTSDWVHINPAGAMFQFQVREDSGRYHLTLAALQAAIKKNIDGLSTTDIKQLKTMMKINSQQFEDVSLMAA